MKYNIMGGLKEYIQEGLRNGISKNELREVLKNRGYSSREIDEGFGIKEVKRVPSVNPSVKKESGDALAIYKEMILNPKGVFEKYKPALGMAMGVFAIISVIALVVSLFVLKEELISLILGIYIIISLVGLGSLSGIYYLIIKYNGGNGTAKETLAVWMYSYNLTFVIFLLYYVIIDFIRIDYAIEYLLFIIPFGVALFSFYILICGLSVVHGVSKGKAFGILATPIMLVWVLII